jgi:hypothetical protein
MVLLSHAVRLVDVIAVEQFSQKLETPSDVSLSRRRTFLKRGGTTTGISTGSMVSTKLRASAGPVELAKGLAAAAVQEQLSFVSK